MYCIPVSIYLHLIITFILLDASILDIINAAILLFMQVTCTIYTLPLKWSFVTYEVG